MAEDSIQVFVFPPLADPHNPCAARPLKKHWGGPPGHEVEIADCRSDQSSPPKASLIMLLNFSWKGVFSEQWVRTGSAKKQHIFQRKTRCC
jgi:hypothetical protein